MLSPPPRSDSPADPGRSSRKKWARICARHGGRRLAAAPTVLDEHGERDASGAPPGRRPRTTRAAAAPAPRDFSSRDRDTTCAEPVLPHTSTSGSRARQPVPSATAAHMPSRTAAIVSGRTPIGRGGSAAAPALTRWGRTRWPPFAIDGGDQGHLQGGRAHLALADRHRDRLPAYQGVFSTRSFHSGLGIRPAASWGRSTPVGHPAP
jgi:hypothetical protein